MRFRLVLSSTAARYPDDRLLPSPALCQLALVPPSPASWGSASVDAVLLGPSLGKPWACNTPPGSSCAHDMVVCGLRREDAHRPYLNE